MKSITDTLTELLAAEEAERHRRVVLVIDEAHLLAPEQLEELRLLTLCRVEDYAEQAAGGPRRSCSGGWTC